MTQCGVRMNIFFVARAHLRLFVSLFYAPAHGEMRGPPGSDGAWRCGGICAAFVLVLVRSGVYRVEYS